MERELSPRRDVVSFVRLLRLMRARRPDVVNYGTPKAALLTSVAAWICRVPRRVYVVRGLRYEGATGLQRSVLLFAERVASGLATDVVAVSGSVASAYRRDIAPRVSVVVIGRGSSNGVRPRVLPSEDMIRDLRRRYVGDGQQIVLFVGRHHVDKGFDDLVAALSQPGLASCVLVSVGPLESATSTAASVLSDGGRWYHVPWSDDPQLFMAAADLLCLPTRREGFSNVLVESQLMGTPVIANDVTGTGEALLEGKTGLLVPCGDVTRLAEAIAKVVHDPGTRDRMGRAGHSWCMEEFQQERIWSGLDAVYCGRQDDDRSEW